MGCKLIRGETIYFVRQGGPATSGIHAEWYRDDYIDGRLLPRVYTSSDEHPRPSVSPSVIPIEIRTFEAS
jgi:hypothetical protein